MRRYVGAGLVMLTLLSGCAVESESIRIGRIPGCDHPNTGRLLLMAQSVPSAQLIPCIEELPEGWILEHADVGSGRSRLQFDSAASMDVLVYLLPSCSQIGDLIHTESGVDSYIAIDSTHRVEQYVFDGGCIRLEVPVGEEANRMADAIGMITRNTLRQLSGWEL